LTIAPSYRSAVPFVILEIIGLMIVMVFPEIASFLVEQMK